MHSEPSFDKNQALETMALLKEFLASPLSHKLSFRTFVDEESDAELSSSAKAKLANAKNFFDSLKGQKSGRLYIDGCFDMMHSGHFNAIRKSKMLCRELVVGTNSDADIIKHKGPPIMNGEERAAMVRACKWVDEVIADTPYVSDIPLLDKFNCQYIGHGDDIIIGADGKSIYSEFEDVGRMR